MESIKHKKKNSQDINPCSQVFTVNVYSEMYIFLCIQNFLYLTLMTNLKLFNLWPMYRKTQFVRCGWQLMPGHLEQLIKKTKHNKCEKKGNKHKM